jgi:hypothetical protein
LDELLRRQREQDDADHKEYEVRYRAFQQEVAKRRKKLLARYLRAARTQRQEPGRVWGKAGKTADERKRDVQERDIDARAARDAEEQVAKERAGLSFVPDPRATPWKVALSHLFSALQTPLTDDSDPNERLARRYRSPDGEEPTSDESALREYLVQVRVGGIRETTRLSAELARLDSEGFGSRLAECLRQTFPEEMQEILAAVPRPVAGTTDKRAAGFEAGSGRLALDPETLTVTLDGVSYKVSDPKAFAVYGVIVEASPQPVTKADIRREVRGCRGSKKVRELLDKLPEPLAMTVSSNVNGYWLDLSATPRRKKGRT